MTQNIRQRKVNSPLLSTIGIVEKLQTLNAATPLLFTYSDFNR